MIENIKRIIAHQKDKELQTIAEKILAKQRID